MCTLRRQPDYQQEVSKGGMVECAFRGWVWVAVLLVVTPAAAQTFDVNGQSPSSPSVPANKRSTKNASNETGMGWGNSIEVAREARAAQTALQQGDLAGATAHAQRAANAAPQNSDLWFTLAYAARLSGHYSLSVDAYRRG